MKIVAHPLGAMPPVALGRHAKAGLSAVAGDPLVLPGHSLSSDPFGAVWVRRASVGFGLPTAGRLHEKVSLVPRVTGCSPAGCLHPARVPPPPKTACTPNGQGRFPAARIETGPSRPRCTPLRRPKLPAMKSGLRRWSRVSTSDDFTMVPSRAFFEDLKTIGNGSRCGSDQPREEPGDATEPL